MKTCDKCKGILFKVEFKVWGIVFICVQCEERDTYDYPDYEG